MMHPYVIDTSVIYCLTGIRSKKTRLAALSKRFLGLDIQQDHKSGHDPKEDAEAAMLV
jgi:RNA exonuclease 1